MISKKKGPPAKLPPLRAGLSLKFNDYDLHGKPQWVIYDPARNKFFIIGWMEHEIIKRWDLGTPEAIIEAVTQETSLHIDTQDIENILLFLAQNFLLNQSGYQIYKYAKEQKLFKTDNFFSWLVSYYLFFRIPLARPDKFLIKTKIISDIIFSRTAFYIMMFLGMVAIYQISMRWELFTHTFTTLISLQGLVLYLFVYIFCKFCHELGHAYMCRRYGIPVPTLGVAFLVFWPVMYTDTSLSWKLPYKARLQIALAGMWVETYITIIAALIWCATTNITLQSITYLVVAVNWVASLLINVSPFMRFDGYYVLSDLLKMPNLQSRAFALTRWQLRHWLFGWTDPPPEKFPRRMHAFLIIYSITTWLYRLVLYFGIALLVYHLFIKVLGILLFFIEIYYFILAPIVHEIKTWYMFRDKFRLNFRLVSTLLVLSGLVFLFFVPVQKKINMPATLSYSHRFLVAPQAGVLVNDPLPVGTAIKANQPIFIIRADDLEQQMQQINLEYQKTQAELRRASVDAKFSEQKSILASEANKDQAKYNKLSQMKKNLTITVPFDGVLVETEPDLSKGNMVMKHEWLGDVVIPNTSRIESFAPQTDIDNIKTGMQGYFYPEDFSYPRVPVTVSVIEFLNANELSCRYSEELQHDNKENHFVETPCYHVSDFGGEIPTYASEEGTYVPVKSVYRVLFTVNKPLPISHILRGTVVLESQPRSYASRVFYKLKTLMIEQSGF